MEGKEIGNQLLGYDRQGKIVSISAFVVGPEGFIRWKREPGEGILDES